MLSQPDAAVAYRLKARNKTCFCCSDCFVHNIGDNKHFSTDTLPPSFRRAVLQAKAAREEEILVAQAALENIKATREVGKRGGWRCRTSIGHTPPTCFGASGDT